MRLIIAGLALLAAVAGCSSGGIPAQSAANAHATAAPRARRSTAPLSARIVLPSRAMTAGSHVTAQVIVENNTGHAIRTAGCGLFQVALVSSHYHPLVVWLSCLRRYTIPVGISRYRAPVIARYNSCTKAQPQPGLRRCLPDGGSPPLPPGDYRAILFQIGDLVPAPPPVPVRVTPAGSAS